MAFLVLNLGTHGDHSQLANRALGERTALLAGHVEGICPGAEYDSDHGFGLNIGVFSRGLSGGLKVVGQLGNEVLDLACHGLAESGRGA